jgi:PAS domain S-box-containing protein
MNRFFKDMKLSKKFLLGTGILFIVILSLSVAFTTILSYLNNLHMRLYREQVSSLTTLYWVVRDFYNLRILSLKHIGTEIFEEMVLFENQSKSVGNRLDSNLKKLDDSLKNTPHLKLFEKFKDEFAIYNNDRLKEIELSSQYLKRDAFYHANTRGYGSFEIAAETLKNLVNKMELDAEKSYQKFANVTKKSIFLSGIFLILILALILLYHYAFSHYIIQPIEKMEKTIRSITERKEWGRKIVSERKDEIGKLIYSFNELSQRMKESSEEIERKNIELQEYSSGLERLVEERTFELKRSMEKYLELWRTLNEILMISPDAIITTDTDLSIVGWNPSAERIFGYKEEEIKGKRLTILMDEKEREEIDELINSLEIKPLYRMDSIKINKEGKGVPCDFFLSPLFGQERKRVGYVAIIKDLTERKMLEQEILHMKKMEGISALAAGIAHDFNNILGAILGYSSFLKSLFNKDDREYKYIDTIEKSAMKGVNLTENLLNLYRPSPPKFEPINLNDILNEIILLVEKSFENIIIEKELSPEISLIEGDRSQIYHAILNLMMNAQEAMEKGGKIKLKTGEKERKEEKVSKKYVFLSVKDSGHGIPEDIIGKIFDPFFTTKEEGKGTGLGLTMVSNIIKRHNGLIEVFSEVGKGAEFILLFPAVEKKELKVETKEREKVKIKEGSVLVIEDDDEIRELLMDFLETIGLKILSAKNGEEGLKIYKENVGEISLVILDVHMPGLTGFEVQKELRRIKEDLKILWISGLVRESRIPLDENSLFLPKPFTIESLSDFLQKLLGN